MEKLYFCKKNKKGTKRVFKALQALFPLLKIKRKDCLGECKTCRSCPFVLHNGKVLKEEHAKTLYWEINKHIAQNKWKNAQTKN
jgi:uncharacterized protein YuzB (UPF0349 family)